MADPDMKKALMECLKDREVTALIGELIRAAVAEATAAKDAEIAELKVQLRRTNDQLNELEYSRRLCMNISGIPETAGEATDQIVTDLAKMVGVTIAPSDIDSTHRVGKPSDGKTRNIIVRFTNFPKRQQLYNARRELRMPKLVRGSTVTPETAKKAYLSDNLTRQNQHTMFVARGLKKEGKLHSAWTDVGRMKIRLRGGGPTTVIRSLDDLYAAADPERQAGVAAAVPEGTDNEGHLPAQRGGGAHRYPRRTR